METNEPIEAEVVEQPSRPATTPNDREKEKPYSLGWARCISGLIMWVVVLMLCIRLDPTDTLTLKIGACLLASGIIAPFLLVYVPEVTGLVALNAFSGNLVIFGPGLHFKFIWDTVRKENFVSLELVTERHQETYAAHDGPEMWTKWSYQYEPRLSQLDAFIAVDKTTIDDGFTDVISSILSDIIGDEMEEVDQESEWMREHVKAVEKNVLRGLEEKSILPNHRDEDNEGQLDEEKEKPRSLKDKLEEKYGVNFVLFSLADIDFDEEYQKARAGKARMKVVLDAAREAEGLGKDGTPTRKSIQLVLNEQGKAGMNIVDTWGEADPLQRAAATHGAMTGGGN